MIEVPAAALQVGEILPQVDSVSIGLNDLTQYLLAADRDDEFVERYHDAMQPAVLRLLQAVVAAATAAAKPLTICGELAGDPKLTGLLLALGVRRLSVARSSYRGVVNSVRQLAIRSMEGIGTEVASQPTAAAVRKYVGERFR
jgi:phosphoenolpyruvate-protein kinase (PTS system EI component)